MDELYTLTIELESGAYARTAWKRVVEMPETTDLYDLHLCIQDIVEFATIIFSSFSLVGVGEIGKESSEMKMNLDLSNEKD